MVAEDAVLEAVSANCRRFRRARGLTYDALAKRSSISKGMLVEIEKGRANPSIAILCRLANALGASLAEILAHDRQTNRLIEHKRGAGKVCWETKRGNRAVLIDAVRLPDIGLEIWRWTLAPHEHFDGAAHGRGTCEYLCVLRGRLTVHVAGEAKTAAAGAVLRLLADASHRYSNDHAQVCEFHMVVAEPVT